MIVVMMMIIIICQSWVLTNDQRWDLVKALVGQLPLGSVRSGSGSEQVFLGFAFDNSLQHIGIVRKSYIVMRNSKCDKRCQMVVLIVF